MKKKQSIFETGWNLHETLKGSQLKPAVLQKVKGELQVLTRFLKLSRLDTIVLNAIVQDSLLDGETELKAIATHFNLNSVELPRINKSIDSLISIGYIQREEQAFGKSKKRVSPLAHVSDAFMTGDQNKLKQKPFDGLSGFFEAFAKLQDSRKRGNIDCAQFISHVVRLCKRSVHLPVVKYFESLDLPKEELVMLIFICDAAYKGTDSVDVSDAVGEITSERYEFFNWTSRFRTQEITLMKEELIEFTLFDMGIDTEVSLTQPTLEKLFSQEDSKIFHGFKPSLTHYLTPEKISATTLFFSEELNRQLTRLRDALLEENYRNLTHRLKNLNLRGGFTILLHGLPGTGKTECVYQLARETGRAVLRLEISRIRSAWVGESEKNLKKVFSEYKRAQRTHINTPILLFNEADAIFSRRGSANNSVDRMENAMQNILLQELEDFNGILAATTNLTQNLDPAFERRFLYKLEFKVPDAQVREQILLENFKQLDPHALRRVSVNCEFTGSAIENIRRKLMLHDLLGNAGNVTIQELEQLLIEESRGLQMQKNIGFKTGS